MKKYRGISYHRTRRYWVVRLSLNGEQRIVETTTVSEEEAAKMYDMALWRLLAWSSPYAFPNFPDDFPAIQLSDVQKKCPNVIKIYYELCDLDTKFNRDPNEKLLDREKELTESIEAVKKAEIKLLTSPIEDQLKQLRDLIFSLELIEVRSQQIAIGLKQLMKKTPRAGQNSEILSQEFQKLDVKAKCLLAETEADLEYLKSFYFHSK